MDQNNKQKNHADSETSNTYSFESGSLSGNHGPINIGETVITTYNNVKQHPLLVSLGVIGIFIIIILMITFFYPKQETEATKLIKEFEGAILKEDVDAIEDMISPDDSDMELEEEYLHQLCDYAKGNPEFLSQTFDIMNAQKALYEDEKNPEIDSYLLRQSSNEEIMSSGIFYLKQEWGLFSDSYTIGVRPQYIQLTSNNPDAVIEVDGEVVLKTKKANSTKVGPLFPGIHKIHGERYFHYTDTTETYDTAVNLFDFESVTPVEINITGTVVKAESDLAGVQVLLNGKPTPFAVKKDKMEVYPVRLDGSQKIQGSFQLPWGGVLKSEELVIEAEYDLYDITPDLWEEKKVVQLMNTFIEDFNKALNEEEVGYFKSVSFKGVFGSYNSFQDYIDRHLLNKSSFGIGLPEASSIEETEIVGDYYPGVVKLDKTDEGYYLNIPLSFKFSNGFERKYSLRYQYKNGKFQLLKISEI
ncbi:hypothetical protein ACFO25_15460 [Paenactinomyces guangxiensis]|uniref:Uncharacterized protein n=1 Tax=Paenactinomyces guangxiensis TaxID=1490290 RepID=A0A7W1WT89_9BACL|nr:hypothetical protein [Paenactinomyces guangxiensis]MBA4495567.1 hypothetical protein [Paenactinomyces guangxiensis]MBH8592825.1 hypothetical protein [Paenactinomyces guangxiensis]